MSLSKQDYQAIAQVIAEESHDEFLESQGEHVRTVWTDALVDRLADAFQELEMCPKCRMDWEHTRDLLGDYTPASHITNCLNHPGGWNSAAGTCHMFDRAKWEAACKEAVGVPDPDITHYPPAVPENLP